MLSRLLVRNFRCFSEAELSLQPGTTIFTGSNGQGKTSLLEAICILMRLQSPRSSSRTDWIQFDEKNCLIEGDYDDRQLRFAQSKATRRLAVNNAVCGRSGDYLQSTALVVWMDYSDMQLVRGNAEHRRRFLDFTASQLFPDYLTSLRSYERILRSRNYLLKKDLAINWRQADAYAAHLEQHGAVIARCRRSLINNLLPAALSAHQHLSGGQENSLLEYHCGYEEGQLQQQLRDARGEEERTRSTFAGVHRDDLVLTINQRPAMAFASEGQQRTLSLALKLAQTQVLENKAGKPPLLLLDDVFGELDKQRRAALLAYLPENSQKLVTTTFLDWMEALPGCSTVREVKRGEIL